MREYLDIREINGYSIQHTTFRPGLSSSRQKPIENVIAYIGLPENPQFMGPQEPDALARHILDSKGPSGENRDYLYQLGRALEDLSLESGDEHVGDLVRRCRGLEQEGMRETPDPLNGVKIEEPKEPDELEEVDSHNK